MAHFINLTPENYQETLQEKPDSEPLHARSLVSHTPGFGRWLTSPEIGEDENYDTKQSDFDMGHAAWSAFRATTREIAMIQLMNEITEKENWEKKVFDEQVVSKWREEAKALPKVNWSVQEYEPISETAFDFSITELRSKAQEFEKHKFVVVLDTGGRVVKSDHLVREDLRQRLISACAPLQDVPESERDWHPGSNQQVLNLVHPSLYPLVYGRTRALWYSCTDLSNWKQFGGQGKVIPTPKLTGDTSYAISNEFWSSKFQWLPCDVKFSGSLGGKPKIVTYINNLEPEKYAELYDVIEEFIDLSIPLWNDCLALKRYCDTPETHRITCLEAHWERRDESEIPGDQNYKWSEPRYNPYGSFSDEQPDADIDNDFMERYNQDAHRWYEIPEPQPWNEYVAENVDNGRPIDLKTRNKAQGLQIIVKLASIELTPSNPVYPGGNWHLEGMMNERIVATTLFYYDSANITDNALSFRQVASMDDTAMVYDQDDHGGLEMIYGTKLRDGAPFQDLGTVPTKQGRIIAFPNVLHHRVGSFGLADPTQPGHRRLLVLWLVDPDVRITSTANVPPQQRHWWPDETLAREDQLLARAKALPPELQREIYKHTGTENWAITEKEARSFRRELMKERTGHQDTVNENAQVNFEYNFCEH